MCEFFPICFSLSWAWRMRKKKKPTILTTKIPFDNDEIN